MQASEDYRAELYDHPVIGPALGIAGTTEAVAATTITDSAKLGSSNFGPNSFNGLARIILPTRSGSELSQIAGTLAAGGVLSRSGSGSWAAAPDPEPYEIIWSAGKAGFDYHHMQQAQQLAAREVYFLYHAPVGPWKRSDGNDNSDFTYGVGEWSESGADLAIEATTNRLHNRFGSSGMLLTNTALVSRYAYHTLGVPVVPGRSYYFAAIARIISGSGTATFALYDATSTLVGVAQVGQTRSITGAGTWWHAAQRVTIPSGCTRLQMRITVPAGMALAIDSLPGHGLSDLWFDVPDFFDEDDKFQGLTDATYGSPVTEGVDVVAARTPSAWAYKTDFLVILEGSGSNPAGVQILTGKGRRAETQLPARDLLLSGLRRESDRVDMSARGALFTGNEEMYRSALRWQFANLLEGRDRLGPNGTWQTLMRQERARLDAQRVTREETPLSIAVEPARRSMAV